MTDTTMLAQAVQLFNAAACEHHTRCGYGDPSCNACTAAGLDAALPLLLAAVVDEAATGPHNAGRVWFTRQASGLNVALSPSEVLAALTPAATRVLLAAQPQQQQQGKKEGEG